MHHHCCNVIATKFKEWRYAFIHDFDVRWTETCATSTTNNVGWIWRGLKLSRPHSTFFAFVKNYNHRYVTHARERECRGEPVPQDTQLLAGVVGDSRERDSGVSMYVCGLRVERIVRIGAISGRSRWPVARVRLHEHEQPDCRRESSRIRWLLMSFWCHSLLSSSLSCTEIYTYANSSLYGLDATYFKLLRNFVFSWEIFLWQGNVKNK